MGKSIKVICELSFDASLYASTVLGKTVSVELKRRMQGKSCFNFKVSDEDLFKEIESLTAHGFEECKG